VLSLRAGAVPCRVAVFIGQPLREAVVWGGPFVMNDEMQIIDAKRRFSSGAMGHLAPYARGAQDDPLNFTPTP
jgi:redox-sensitive bicupin YhaK (pirin superfamily)